jgi:DNA repair exonuclease SbcCD ATPase subunit
MRTCEIARYFGMTPDLLREIVVDNARVLGAHKDSQGKWEMPMAKIPHLASMFGKRGLQLNSASALLLELIAQLNRRNAERYENILELKARQSDLENENKALNEKLVRAVDDSSQRTTELANGLIALAKEAVERTPVPVPEKPPAEAIDPPQVSELQTPQPITPTPAPVPSPKSSSLVPVLVGVVLLVAWFFLAHLYYRAQQQAVAGANKMISSSLDAMSEVSKHAQDDLKNERQAAEDKQKQLDLVQAQQKDISKQLFQSQANLKATVKLLQGERDRRNALETTLTQSLEAQKKLNASQAQVISVQQTELEALKKQLLSVPAKGADAPRLQDYSGKK